MSYDFAIEIDGRSEEPYFSDVHPGLDHGGVAGTVALTTAGYVRCGNYTSNVSGMWTRCLTAALERLGPEERTKAEAWRGDDDRRLRARYESQRDRPIDTERLCLRDLEGKRAGDLVPLLRAAVEWGVEYIEELHEDDPSNGWGDADGAVTYLWDIQRSCEEQPDGRLYISS